MVQEKLANEPLETANTTAINTGTNKEYNNGQVWVMRHRWEVKRGNKGAVTKTRPEIGMTGQNKQCHVSLYTTHVGLS